MKPYRSAVANPDAKESCGFPAHRQVVAEVPDLPPIRWSRETALDPKHRPQLVSRPSTTVRREWARYPQEAHLFDRSRKRIRRLRSDEIAILQGFDPSWFEVPEVTVGDRIRAAGNAVPPPLARAVLGGLTGERQWRCATHIELCAGAGGFAAGLADEPIETVALVELWAAGCKILRHEKPWPAKVVHENDVKQFSFSQYRGKIGILTGGLPCQPWSNAGLHSGSLDPRDLMGMADEFVKAIEPEAFVFENVPGLASEHFGAYFGHLLERLRRPARKLRYGVMPAILNAACFGVPQLRRRLFIIGIRDAATSEVSRVFDRIDTLATHRLPRQWITVGKALAATLEEGKWMRWPYDDPLEAAGNQSDD